MDDITSVSYLISVPAMLFGLALVWLAFLIMLVGYRAAVDRRQGWWRKTARAETVQTPVSATNSL